MVVVSAFAETAADTMVETAFTPSVAKVRDLVWAGRPDEAVRALRRVEEQGHDSGQAAEDWIAVCYPERIGAPRVRSRGGTGFDVLCDLLATRAAPEAVREAQTVLGSCPMTTDALASLSGALAALVYADRADLAARWCRPLLEQTTAHCDPVWLGVFAAIRGETMLRQGDPAEAAECVRTALTHIPWQDWGVAIGIPFGTMIAAKTALGMTEDVIRYLAVPVPDAMWETPAGLHYLAARAEFRLASGNAGEALGDFLACGKRMLRWGIDLPGVVAWRVGAGHARLALGECAEAAVLAREQLAACGGARTRAYGAALRLLALAGDPDHRRTLLEEAYDVLRGAGDAREAERAKDDLGPARAAARSLLSDAEAKVAELAALGLSNRQISSRLYITVSTVEQHLTRIYRKLGARRRSQLSEFL
ncbi:helix-turn-helix transcriptional regulator [Actinocorallia sp. A-T 12471]|uniref:helix-turn-helix transcriptional regulator n=1 Tax=Actinocorallia sp. A-T 12471 TaxID=3089813 RepID=UPI0029CFE21E|nr:helix-turn-helix transcriptional regulator [Actinocorallia sp. A-T 12471]MDX6741099.1 helix-turn-helix transcriptional regulator [Actinocorallia sp. A-T 12471]